MSNPRRLSFEEACRELGITEAELESLVAAGEIASIKEGDTLYFKEDVVKKFKKQRESEPTILLSDDDVGLLEGDLEEIDLLAGDEPKPAKSGAQPAPKGKGPEPEPELSLDDGLPDLDLVGTDAVEVTAGTGAKGDAKVKNPKNPESEGDETLLNLDGLLEEDSEGTTPVPVASEGGDDATMLDTDLLDLAGESDPFSADTAEETVATELTEAGTLLRGGGARVMQMKRKAGHPWLTGLLALAAILLVLPLGVLTNVMFGSAPEAQIATTSKDSGDWFTEHNYLGPAMESLADFFKPAK